MQPDVRRIVETSTRPLDAQMSGKVSPKEHNPDSLSCPTPINGALHESQISDGGDAFSFMHPPSLIGHETNFHPLAASAFLAEPEEMVDWVHEDYCPAGGVVILAGKPKEGKTTLAYELVVKVSKGEPFLGRTTTQGGVLILALEEHRRDVRLRLSGLGMKPTDPVFVHVGPLTPSRHVLTSLRAFIVEHKITFLLVDTLAAFWSVEDENDAAAVTKAVKPLLALARESKACVMLIHHARKSDGQYGDEIRGSGALFALADVALILKRHEVENQRKLVGISRYPETPPELIIELRDAGYVALGDPSLVNKAARKAKLKAALGPVAEEAAMIIKRAGLSLRDGQRLLAALTSSGDAVREGMGRKGSPFTYRSYLLSCDPPSPRMNGIDPNRREEILTDES